MSTAPTTISTSSAGLPAGPSPSSRTRRLARLFAALPAGVVVLDGHGRIREFNEAARRLLGALRVGEAWRALVAQAFAPSAEGGDACLADGRRVHIDTCSLGTEPGQIVLLADVTETRRLEERLARMTRLADTGRMLASLAHQIRTPLACALIDASALGPDEEGARARDRLVERLRHLERLIEDWLRFTRGGDLGVEPVEPGILLRALAEVFAPAVAAGRVRVSTAGPATSLPLRGNREALLSVLQNLVANALEAGTGETRVEVDAVAEAGCGLAIRVADDGPGIPDALRERVFEPFFTTRAGGTGLGLAVVRATARAHGGEVSLVPREGGGSLFRLHLPLDGPMPAPSAPASGRAGSDR